MRASSLAALLALTAGTVACSRFDAPTPEPRSIEPARAYVGSRTPVVIRGDGFAARAAESTSGGSPQVDVSHRAWLGGVELEAVTWVDAHTLRAVVPAGLPLGRLTLAVENAFGRRGELARAFEVVASAGAVLTATLEPGPALVSVGQVFPLTVRVTNSGFAAARDVTAAVTATAEGGAGVSLVGPTPASVATLDPGEAVTLTWSCQATSAGQVTLSATGAATDTFSGRPVGSAPAATGLTVQLPPGLVATIQASRTIASTGQAVGVTLTVTNGGDASADLTAVTPTASPAADVSCTTPSPSWPPATVPSATSVVFTWACTSWAAGDVALSATVAGADANSGAPLSAEPTLPAALTIQTPASLSASVALPTGMTTVSVGQPVTVTLTVANSGVAPATLSSLAPAASPLSAAACGAPSPAPPVTLAGGASASFTWTCTPALAGTLALGGAVAGADANSGAPVAATAASRSLTVQLPAAVAAIVSAGRTVASVGQAVGVTFTVTNGGSAAANVSAVVPLTSGTAAATCGSPTPPPPVTILSGEARTFTWSCTGTTSGSLALSGRATGTDANSGAALSATPSTAASVTVQAAAAVSTSAFTATPTTASTGQAIAVSLTLANSGGAAARVSALAPTVSPATDAACTAVDPAPPQTLPAGTSRTFAWSCAISSATAPRTLGASVTWNDVNTGTDQTLTPTPIPVTLQAPGALTATLTAGAAAVDTGQPVAVSLSLANSGAASTVIGAIVPSFTPATATTCTAPSPAPPRTVAGGASLTFTWSCTATTAGSRTLGAAVGATDANSGAGVPASVTGLPVAVQDPAAISAALSAPGTPASVAIGTPVSLSLDVSNAGQATANLTEVSPTVAPAGAAACTAPAPTPPRTVAGGATQTFAWTCTPSLPGSITFGATVSGADVNSGAGLAATATPPVSVTAAIPAALTATVSAGRSTATVGQPVGVTFSLTNGGTGAANITAIAPSATGLTAGCGAVAPALPQTLAPAATLVFSWTCTPAVAGALALSGSATGTDAASGLGIAAAPAVAAGVTVQTAPALSVTGFSAGRAAANVGQAVSVSLTLANAGGATAAIGAVTPAFEPAGSGACTAASPPAPASIPGGGSATFTWSCTGTAAASATLGVAVAATDANTGATAPVSVTPLALAVQQPAALAASALGAAPATATVGQAIAVSLTLSNSGGASAAVSGVVPTVSPASAAACGAVTPSLPVTLAEGSSRTFTWSCVPSAAGAVTLGATVTGTDANSGAALAPAVAGAAATVLTPAALTAAVAIAGSPTIVNVGTPLTLTLTVSDRGGADATVTAVTPTVSGTGAATCGTPTPAPPTALPAGGTVTYGWTCTPTAAGSVTVGATVAGADAVSGAALTAAASAPVTVQGPAALSPSLAAGRSVASVGQAVPVTFTLTDTGAGGATVTAVTPTAAGVAATCTPPSPALPLSLAGGQVATLTWSCTASEAGTMSLGATATGTDVTSGGPLTATATAVAVTVQTSASLAVSAFAASRTTADPGQRVDLNLTVHNQGAATAQISAVTPSIDPSGSCSTASPAPPQALAGGASLALTWSCTPTAVGTASLGAAIAATDGNSGAAAGTTATPIALEVQAPAALSGAVSGTPSPQLVGQPIAFTVTLSNTGGATANVSAVAVSKNPGNLTCTAPTPAPPQSVPGGQGLALAWSCTSSQARAYTVGATVTATDANTGGAVTATVTSFSASWATTIAAAAFASALSAPAASILPAAAGEVLTVSTDALGDGSASGAIVELAGEVLVGLDASGSALVRFDASGAPRRVPLALGVDAGATPAANGAWLASAPATTLGAPGCAPGSFGCGPDDEAGLAAAASGPLDGAERLALAGAGRYVYVASPAEGLLEGAWIDLRAVLPGGASRGATVLASSALGGLAVAVDGGAGAPRVVAVPRMPGAGGLDAGAADVTDLGAAEAAGPGAPLLAERGGVLYVAAAGGIARWDAGWRVATPASAAWTARTPSTSAAAVAWPRDRAVPGLAAFGACGTVPCLFAGRNVAGDAGGPAAAPQLWRCAPTGAAGACTPGDWSLVAPDPADPLVTRLGAAGGAVSLVVETPGWLYVGIDDDVLGARLYRASRAPSAASDLVGRDGCSASSASCEGLGGNGFGVGATRLAGAARSASGGVTSLWILAGDGERPLRLLRIADR